MKTCGVDLKNIPKKAVPLVAEMVMLKLKRRVLYKCLDSKELSFLENPEVDAKIKFDAATKEEFEAVVSLIVARKKIIVYLAKLDFKFDDNSRPL